MITETKSVDILLVEDNAEDAELRAGGVEGQELG